MNLPRVTPIIPRLVSAPFDDKDWIFEMKYDGFRALFYKQGDQCKFVSKKNFEYKRFEDALTDICSELRAYEAIFDGELAVFDEQGKPIFKDLLHQRGQAYFAAFDILWLNGEDLRRLPLIKRKSILRFVLRDTARIFGVDYVSEKGVALFDAIQKIDLEGIVAKKKSDPYAPSVIWRKIKNPRYSQKQGREKLFKTQKNLSRPRG